MALPSKNLPFEYIYRWNEVGGLFVPSLSAQTVEKLEERDRNLEDYLANLGSGGSCFPAIRLIELESSIPATSSGNFDWDGTMTTAGYTAYQTAGWTFPSPHMVSPPVDGFFHIDVCLGFTAGGTVVTGDLLAQLRVGTSTADDLILAADSAEFFGEDPTETFYLHLSCDAYITAAQSVWVSYGNGMDVALDPINVGSISIHGFCAEEPVTFSPIT